MAEVSPLGRTATQKKFDGIPVEWHQTIKVYNRETKRAKLYFQCKFAGCDSIFRKSCNLRDHFRKHTATRPFLCDICNKQFTQSGNLGRHLKNVHGQNRKDHKYDGFKVKLKVKSARVKGRSLASEEDDFEDEQIDESDE